jgi:hypothetical protein
MRDEIRIFLKHSYALYHFLTTSQQWKPIFQKVLPRRRLLFYFFYENFYFSTEEKKRDSASRHKNGWT